MQQSNNPPLYAQLHTTGVHV